MGTTGQMLEAQGYEQGWDIGYAEGWRAGYEEGRVEGIARLLTRLLFTRFGEVPAAVLDRIQRETDEATLIAWGDRLFDARTPEEVIEG